MCKIWRNYSRLLSHDVSKFSNKYLKNVFESVQSLIKATICMLIWIIKFIWWYGRKECSPRFTTHSSWMIALQSSYVYLVLNGLNMWLYHHQTLIINCTINNNLLLVGPAIKWNISEFFLSLFSWWIFHSVQTRIGCSDQNKENK